MRPNLMSPRRSTSGEDSILAMLEREPARKRGARTSSGPRLVWYGASALLALSLTGALVWLAANNDDRRPDVQDAVLAEAVKSSDLPTPNTPALLQVAMAPPEVRSPQAAVIVDQAPASDAVPPLRLLKSAQDKAAPVRVPVPAATSPQAAARSAPAPRPAVVAPVEAKAAPAPRPKPVLAAKSAPRPAAPKAPRSAPPAKPGEPAVDADVALISAVIVHANGHAPQNSQMTELLCPNDNCQARPPRQ
ncbi:hypothetical protein LK542_06235 [Massilia sp. IC2-477]|uniref:hypothetical protein n=1 Tax=Massilia sp. IC2-477 TaxID=2887198 RepID=UPI001D100E63|nr:hypothetical protein [Massilia sp. IC2-477]MCC2955214.1 hypothetical protein [Massilia sp. IC2-477]